MSFLVWKSIENWTILLSKLHFIFKRPGFSEFPLVSILLCWLFCSTPVETSLPIPHGPLCYTSLVALKCGFCRQVVRWNMHFWGLPGLPEPSFLLKRRQNSPSLPQGSRCRHFPLQLRVVVSPAECPEAAPHCSTDLEILGSPRCFAGIASACRNSSTSVCPLHFFQIIICPSGWK